MKEDACPTCRFDLGRHCYDEGLFAGDRVTCPDCGDLFLLGEMTDGTEDWYVFEREETESDE